MPYIIVSMYDTHGKNMVQPAQRNEANLLAWINDFTLMKANHEHETEPPSLTPGKDHEIDIIPILQLKHLWKHHTQWSFFLAIYLCRWITNLMLMKPGQPFLLLHPRHIKCSHQKAALVPYISAALTVCLLQCSKMRVHLSEQQQLDV